MDYDALEGKQLEKCISLMIDLINRKGAYDSAAFRKQKQIVTGPSFKSSTFMSAPKVPVPISLPNAAVNSLQNFS